MPKISKIMEQKLLPILEVVDKERKTVYLKHEKPEKLFSDLWGVRSKHFPHWKNGVVRFKKHHDGVEIVFHSDVELVVRNENADIIAFDSVTKALPYILDNPPPVSFRITLLDSDGISALQRIAGGKNWNLSISLDLVTLTPKIV